ncbi:MAG: DUF1206 domain-containing protein [Dermatophilaceae bacterium]|nr:DUF1206 domain-containing protein [Intrasporangiaceae bacterium]
MSRSGDVDVTSGARRAGDHPVVEKGARLGYAMSGLIHLLIGWIAIKVAWDIDGGSDDADQSGALATVANTTTGPILLWLAVIGFALLALWQLTEAIVGRHGGGFSDRAKAAGKMVMYAVIAWSAYRVTQRAGDSSEESTQSFTAQIMDQPGGRILIGLIGVGIVAGGGHHVYKGWTCRFLEDLDEHPGRVVEVAGRAGYVAKGLSLVVVGGLFVTAAVSSRASEAGGLDAALKMVRDQPFGPFLLTIVAVGIAAYGFYSFGRARHAKL